MMKLKLFLAIGLISGALAFSQEIKVKKGEIQVDAKPIAKIDKEKGIYTISDLTGKPLFKAIITNETPLKNTAKKQWLQLTGNNGNVRELELIEGTTFFGFEKPITQNLILSENPLLPKTGINEEIINNFFLTEDRSISTAEDLIVEKDNEINRREDSIALANQLTINNNGDIEAHGKKIGSIARKTNSKDLANENVSYWILDLNKISIAKLDFSTSGNFDNLFILTYDNKKLPILRTKYTNNNVNTDKLASRVVKTLYANGYTLGDMKSVIENENQRKIDDQNQKISDLENQAKADSRNIYDVSGYVFDTNGMKKEGTITIEFESIDKKLGREKNISDLTNYGGVVSLTSNGKKENYKAKDGVKFCTGETCYIGLAGTNILGGSTFTKILYENNNNYIVIDTAKPTDLYLKLSPQQKAVYLGKKGSFGTRKPEKIKKAFDEYINCSSLDFSKYDTETKEGLIQVISDYLTSCK